MRTKTSDFTDDDYDNSGVDHSEYTENYGEPKESNFTLEREVQEVKDKNIELYSIRVELGLDIFTGKPLKLSDLLATRSLGHLPINVGFAQLTHDEKQRYPKERKYYEV